MARKWNDPVPFPDLKGLDPVVRRARLIEARKHPNGSVRRAILMGHWDGGSVLAKYGVPLTLPLDTPNRPCEALEVKDA